MRLTYRTMPEEYLLQSDIYMVSRLDKILADQTESLGYPNITIMNLRKTEAFNCGTLQK